MTVSFALLARRNRGGWRSAHNRIQDQIIGDLKKEELIQLDLHLDEMAKAIEKKVELIFKSKSSCRSRGKSVVDI